MANRSKIISKFNQKNKTRRGFDDGYSANREPTRKKKRSKRIKPPKEDSYERNGRD